MDYNILERMCESAVRQFFAADFVYFQQNCQVRGEKRHAGGADIRPAFREEYNEHITQMCLPKKYGQIKCAEV